MRDARPPGRLAHGANGSTPQCRQHARLGRDELPVARARTPPQFLFRNLRSRVSIDTTVVDDPLDDARSHLFGFTVLYHT